MSLSLLTITFSHDSHTSVSVAVTMSHNLWNIVEFGYNTSIDDQLQGDVEVQEYHKSIAEPVVHVYMMTVIHSVVDWCWQIN